MKKQQLNSVIEFDKDLNDVKKPNAIASKICQNDMVDELIADWYDSQFNDFNVFMADYLYYLVWYVYKKKECQKMSKDAFMRYLDRLPQNAIAYKLYQNFISKKIYKKDMEQQLFLLIDEINPLRINREKSQKANDVKYAESRKLKKYVKSFYKQVKSTDNKLSFSKFCDEYKDSIEAKIKQDFPKIAEKLDNPDFVLYDLCK